MKTTIDLILKANGIDFEKEYQFCDRKWRFDFVVLPITDKIAVEFEGGIWSGGRHVRGIGYAGDLKKYNFACVLGWRVLRYTQDVLDKTPMQVYSDIRKLQGDRNEKIKLDR